MCQAAVKYSPCGTDGKPELLITEFTFSLHSCLDSETVGSHSQHFVFGICACPRHTGTVALATFSALYSEFNFSSRSGATVFTGQSRSLLKKRRARERGSAIVRKRTTALIVQPAHDV